jgi:hypothetical protein
MQKRLTQDISPALRQQLDHGLDPFGVPGLPFLAAGPVSEQWIPVLTSVRDFG